MIRPFTVGRRSVRAAGTPGGKPGLFPENAGEVTGIVETEPQRNFSDGKFSFFKQAACLPDAEGADVAGNGVARPLPECAGESRRAHARHAGQFPQGYGTAEMGIDVFKYFGGAWPVPRRNVPFAVPAPQQPDQKNGEQRAYGRFITRKAFLQFYNDLLKTEFFRIGFIVFQLIELPVRPTFPVVKQRSQRGFVLQ